MTIPAILFWLSICLLLHTYVFFPVILWLLARRKEPWHASWNDTDSLPVISVLVAVHNEEEAIEKKIRNIYHTRYPHANMEVLVGSDASDDSTNRIVQELQKEFFSLHLFAGRQRQGKVNILRRLITEGRGSLFVFTDARVFFTPDTLFELIRPFRDERISVAGGRLVNRNMSRTGVALQENTFINQELRMKYHEGLLWGCMIGAYGACFAIRREDVAAIPPGHPSEDFFMSMSPLGKGKKSILAWEAIGEENVPGEFWIEFRRRIRIASGNFTNLATLSLLLWPPHHPVAFCFLSHKVLRWLGPFFLLTALITSLLLSFHYPLYIIALIIQLVFMVVPITDFFLRKIHLHIVILRFISHFYGMNLALLAGFFKFLKGDTYHVWEPTRRSNENISAY